MKGGPTKNYSRLCHSTANSWMASYNASGIITANCWPTNKTPAKQNIPDWKRFSTNYSPPKPVTMRSTSELPKPEPRNDPCCWSWSSLNCPCTTTHQNWESDAELENAMS